MDPSEVRALTFDVFGTVVDWREGIAREAAAILAPKGYVRDWHAFADSWRAEYQPALERVRSGGREWIKLNDLHRENLLRILEKFSITDLAADEREALNRAWGRLDPWPDVVAGLTRLRQKFILAAASNGNVALMIDLARHARLPWDMILGAELAHAYKPRAEVYDRAADLLDLAPAHCMMVAAHDYDLRAARSRGFKTAFVSRPREHGEKAPAPAAAPRDYDVVAADFCALADALGC